jgi:predicted nuclease with TOPRIM domain
MGKFTEEVLTRLTRIEGHLDRNTEVLSEHHKRTTQLEERFKPVEDHVRLLRALLKLGAVTLAAGASVAGILQLFK